MTSTTPKPNITNIVVVHGGELAKDVSEQIANRINNNNNNKHQVISAVTLRSASERPKTLLDYMSLSSDDDDSSATTTLVVFVMQTIENASPTEEVSSKHNIICCPGGRLDWTGLGCSLAKTN